MLYHNVYLEGTVCNIYILFIIIFVNSYIVEEMIHLYFEGNYRNTPVGYGSRHSLKVMLEYNDTPIPKVESALFCIRPIHPIRCM